MSRADEASYVRGPASGSVYKNVMGTAHKVYATPNAWLGQKVLFHAEDGDLHINFGTASSVQVGIDDASTWNSGTKALTVSTTTGARVPADGYLDFDVKDTWTFFAVESDTATAYWIGYLSSAF